MVSGHLAARGAYVNGDTDPVVSVVIPFKDAVPFLRESVRSVLSQSWTALDVVLVDDGGSDGSDAIAREFEAADRGRVRVVSHEGRVNRGTGPSRALGIRQASGSLVAFLDGDDVWEPTHLADQVKLLAENPTADMVCGRVWGWRSWADPDSEDRLSDLAFAPGAVVAGPRLLAAVLRNGSLATSTCALLVRRETLLGCLKHVDAFPDLYEDQVINSWLQLRAAAVMSGGKGAWYRQHETSISARLHSGHSARARLAFLTWLRSQVDELQSSDPEVGELLELALEEARGHVARGRASVARRVAQAVTPPSARRQIATVRRLLARTDSSSRPARAVRINRFLFRHGADVRGDVLLLSEELDSIKPGPAVTSWQTLPWSHSGVAPGPHHPLATLPSCGYDCVVVLSNGLGIGSADLALRHLRRALRPAGVLLFLTPRRGPATEHALRELFGWDAVSSDLSGDPGPRATPLVLLRAVVSAG